MKKALCLLTVITCMCFALACFAFSDDEIMNIETKAIQGDAEAQFDLGLLYEYGRGVKQDYRKAREWFEKAATQDNAEAQYNLGVMYTKGEGVRQNYATAKEWYGKACDNGDQEGCGWYKKLNLKGY